MEVQDLERIQNGAHFIRLAHPGLFQMNLSWNHRTCFDMLKIRASYGINGNDRIPDYAQWGLYGSVQYNGVDAMAPSNLPEQKPYLGIEQNL